MCDETKRRNPGWRGESMGRKSVMLRLSLGLVMAMLLLQTPLAHATSTAGLQGVIRDERQQPLAGVRLLASHRDSGVATRSAPTAKDGGFNVSGLAAGRYDLAIESDAGLYLVPQPVDLVPGLQRHVQIAIAAETTAAPPSIDRSKASMWNNPLSAGAIVLGAAIIVGALVKDLTDDESTASEN